MINVSIGLIKQVAVYLCMLFTLNVTISHADSDEAVTTEIIAKNLDRPWGMAFLPDNNILITERRGKLKLFHAESKKTTEIVGLPKIKSGGQGGLLDIAIDPNFQENRYVYFAFVAQDQNGLSGTEVARAKLKGNQLENLEIIFRAKPKVKNGYHFGSRLLFDDDNLLFISLGDRYAYKDDAQNNNNHHGVLIRIHKDGSIPPDNPFLNVKNSAPEIYSYGHRNIQGLTKHPVTGQIWAHEHGPRGGDELNLIKASLNYGWPKITYGIDYSGAIISEHTHMSGMEQPIVYWVPSIAPSGMIYYKGDKYPDWNDSIFIGALAKKHLRRLKMKNNRVVEQQELLKEMKQRIRDVKLGPDGYIYVLTDERNGQLVKLIP